MLDYRGVNSPMRKFLNAFIIRFMICNRDVKRVWVGVGVERVYVNENLMRIRGNHALALTEHAQIIVYSSAIDTQNQRFLWFDVAKTVHIIELSLILWVKSVSFLLSHLHFNICDISFVRPWDDINISSQQRACSHRFCIGPVWECLLP